MNLDQIRYVLTLARTRNFTKAAEELYITQPTLSQQLQSIEKELGTMLFYRNRRHVSLTESGQIFIPHAQQILNEWETCRDAIQTQPLPWLSSCRELICSLRKTSSHLKTSIGCLYSIPLPNPIYSVKFDPVSNPGFPIPM